MNKQNICMYASVHPYNINGHIITPIRNAGEVLCEQMRRISSVSPWKGCLFREKRFCFGQDGALPHTTNPVLNVPKDESNDRLLPSHFPERVGHIGVDKMMEMLRNWQTEVVCVGYIQRTSVGNTECPSSVCLHSVVLMQVHYWLCWVTVRVKGWKMGDLPDFEREQIYWCAFSESICDRNCHIIRCI
jgi:hypothetical protein